MNRPSCAYKRYAAVPLGFFPPDTPLASYNDLSPSPYPAGSMVCNPPQPSPPSDRLHITLPKLGETRCCEFFPALPNDRSSIELRSRALFLVSISLTTAIVLDWSLLTSDLTFLYLDPVLAAHLGEQAELLIGKSLLTYVHPDEQASARVDLGGVLESRTLHGSVTR